MMTRSRRQLARDYLWWYTPVLCAIAPLAVGLSLTALIGATGAALALHNGYPWSAGAMIAWLLGGVGFGLLAFLTRGRSTLL